jgi:hypothetical protein
MFLPFLYYAYVAKNSKSLESFLRRRKRDPYCRFIFAIGNKNDKEVIEAYRMLIRKKKYKNHFPLFTVIFSLYFEKTDGLEEEVNKIKPTQIRLYYEIMLMIQKTEGKRIEKEIYTIKRKWMKEALLAELERKRGRVDKEIGHAKSALKAARGLQYYILKKEYERLYKL